MVSVGARVRSFSTYRFSGRSFGKSVHRTPPVQHKKPDVTPSLDAVYRPAQKYFSLLRRKEVKVQLKGARVFAAAANAGDNDRRASRLVASRQLTPFQAASHHAMS